VVELHLEADKEYLNGSVFTDDNDAVIDRAPLDEYIEMMGPDGRQSMLELIDVYLSSSPELLQKMQDALATRDLVRLRRAAHSWKSSSASLGAVRLSGLCKALDLQIRAILPDQASETASIPPAEIDAAVITGFQHQVESIAVEFERTRRALQPIQQELGA
jgi:HPt (histidine-containing phosphotransfer) domain-containing protein